MGSDVQELLDAMANCDLPSILGDIDGYEYTAMSLALFKAAQSVGAAGKSDEEKALRLLAEVCTMPLRPASINDPYGPTWRMVDGRPGTVADFNETEIGFFSEVFETLPDRRLRARLADILWLIRQPRTAKCALVAIDSYRQDPLTFAALLNGGQDCQERALRLALILGNGARDRRDSLERQMLDAVEKAGTADGMLALWTARMLFDTGLGKSGESLVAQRLHTLAVEFDGVGSWLRTLAYFEEAERWYARAGNQEEVTAIQVEIAEGFVKQAESRISGDKPSYSVAAKFFEDAVRQYRRIPRKYRTPAVETRMEELLGLVRSAGERSLEELHVFTPPAIDISDIQRRSRETVEGKSLVEALHEFSGITGIPDFAHLRENAVESLRHSLLGTVSVVVLSDTGRVIAKPAGPSDQDDDSDSGALWHEIIRIYRTQIGFGVDAYIWPALEVVRREHRVTREDMEAVVARSSAFPFERTRLVAKALYLGFDNDWIAAIHILAPQVEHLVRWHLNRRGVVTTTLDTNGIENEVGLSALLDRHKETIGKVFGETLAFELKALFADAQGPNLRNVIAHGLVDDYGIPSAEMIYAWWWVFTLAFRTAMHVNQNVGANDSEDSKSAE